MAQIASETPVETPTKKGFGLFAIIALVLVIGLLALLGWGLVNTTRTRPMPETPHLIFRCNIMTATNGRGETPRL